jgi:predicted Holliday junction resolvase-like endonuclease
MPDSIAAITNMTDRELMIELRAWMVQMKTDINSVKASISALEHELQRGYVKREEFEQAVCDMKKNDEKLDNRFVKKEEFEPVRNLVYGAVGIILMAVLSALVYLVVNATP